MQGLSFIRQLFSHRQLHISLLRQQTIPMVVDQDGRIERVYDIYSRLLKDRIVCVMTSMLDDSFNSLSSCNSLFLSLLFLQGESAKSTINMYIMCPGGSVTAGLGIYDTMQYISAPVATWCIGQVIGFLIGLRIFLTDFLKGQASDILIRAEEIGRLKTRLNKIYAVHTGQDIETIEEVLDRDRYMSPEEAKQFGIIDQIETSAFDL
ncbi:Probable ClpP-like protease, putative [Brugia malayi]|uniref:ATP-dependent Clp protease proteolytic subunit n=2 Tax=Brugia TaxID=6278 RepID=A0A0H5S7U2_BRUMA|nr:putative ClpP-like protease, putative [Brugia malayi]CRZ24209.1 BMA-CLPP-1 [Brugia malayi]VIO94485.1 Probable ClpP-like protease, putative [Brugia malayi]